jgi:hypothetical protein
MSDENSATLQERLHAVYLKKTGDALLNIYRWAITASPDPGSVPAIVAAREALVKLGLLERPPPEPTAREIQGCLCTYLRKAGLESVFTGGVRVAPDPVPISEVCLTVELDGEPVALESGTLRPVSAEEAREVLGAFGLTLGDEVDEPIRTAPSPVTEERYAERIALWDAFATRAALWEL